MSNGNNPAAKGISIADSLLVFFTGVLAVAAIAQCLIFWRQWKEMKSQLTVMDRQLDEMRSASKQTDQLINEAAEHARASRIAADAAKVSADSSARIAAAATKSLEYTHEAIYLEQRAWMGVQSIDARGGSSDSGEKLAVDIVIRNTGKTPAKKIKGFAGFADVDRHDAIPDILSQFQLLPALQQKQVLLPGASVTVSREITYGVEKMAKIRKDEIVAYIMGETSYFDIFDHKHTTRYCFRYNGQGNTFSICNEFNDMN
jgi:hypothetical protein